MTITAEQKQILIDSANDLIRSLESGSDEQAELILGELCEFPESKMFKDVGQLTRDLHTSITGIEVDSHLVGLTESDIPDAKERLQHVIEMTNKAAHKTLTAVEGSLPICDVIHEKTVDIGGKWKRFISRDISAEEFRALSREIGEFMENLPRETGELKDHLNEIMMAQDYQDLTGQTISRVITLVQDVEDSLVNFISASSEKESEESRAEKIKAEGPQIPALNNSDRVSGQDEVDDLLSSLGF